MEPKKTYTLKEKEEILQKIEALAPMELCQVSQELNLSISTLSRILKEKDRIKSSASRKYFRARTSKNELNGSSITMVKTQSFRFGKSKKSPTMTLTSKSVGSSSVTQRGQSPTAPIESTSATRKSSLASQRSPLATRKKFPKIANAFDSPKIESPLVKNRKPSTTSYSLSRIVCDRNHINSKLNKTKSHKQRVLSFDEVHGLSKIFPKPDKETTQKFSTTSGNRGVHESKNLSHTKRNLFNGQTRSKSLDNIAHSIKSRIESGLTKFRKYSIGSFTENTNYVTKAADLKSYRKITREESTRKENSKDITKVPTDKINKPGLFGKRNNLIRMRSTCDRYSKNNSSSSYRVSTQSSFYQIPSENKSKNIRKYCPSKPFSRVGPCEKVFKKVSQSKSASVCDNKNVHKSANQKFIKNDRKFDRDKGSPSNFLSSLNKVNNTKTGIGKNMLRRNTFIVTAKNMNYYKNVGKSDSLKRNFYNDGNSNIAPSRSKSLGKKFMNVCHRDEESKVHIRKSLSLNYTRPKPIKTPAKRRFSFGGVQKCVWDMDCRRPKWESNFSFPAFSNYSQTFSVWGDSDHKKNFPVIKSKQKINQEAEEDLKKDQYYECKRNLKDECILKPINNESQIENFLNAESVFKQLSKDEFPLGSIKVPNIPKIHCIPTTEYEVNTKPSCDMVNPIPFDKKEMNELPNKEDLLKVLRLLRQTTMEQKPPLWYSFSIDQLIPKTFKIHYISKDPIHTVLQTKSNDFGTTTCSRQEMLEALWTLQKALKTKEGPPLWLCYAIAALFRDCSSAFDVH